MPKDTSVQPYVAISVCITGGRIQNGSIHVLDLLLYHKHFEDSNHFLIIFVSYYTMLLVGIHICRTCVNLSAHCMELQMDQ